MTADTPTKVKIMQYDNQQQRNEQLSALLDNDMKPEELVQFMDDLQRDPLAEGETLQRYQLIGKTLRGELNAAAFIDVSAAVQRAIDLESVPVTNVRNLRPRWLPNLSTLLRPAAGLAIAASVAVVTVATVRLVQQSEPAAATGQSLAAVTPAPVPAPVVPVNAQVAQQVQVVANTSAAPESAAQASPQLNNYLMRHSGVAGQATMQGVMPYARAVSFEQEGAR
jgi:sigma-E factor negative regulatory protein RseA